MNMKNIVYGTLSLVFCMCLSMACAKGDNVQPDDGTVPQGPEIDLADMTLKEACKDRFLIGAAITEQHVMANPEGFWAKEQEVLKKHFSAIVAEGAMKWKAIHPEKDVYDWTTADAMVEFAEKNGMEITGHCLIWHTSLPDWVWQNPDGTDVSPEVLKQNMKDHITTVMQHFGDRILGWDVVNEAFESESGNYREDSPFYRILGPEFIDWAYQCAVEAMKEGGFTCELYYNDFQLEISSKRQAVLQLVERLRGKGIELDAVGVQAHLFMGYPSVESYDNMFFEFMKAGIKVMITELDLKVSSKENDYPEGLPEELDAQWNQRMTDFFKVFLKYDYMIPRVGTWGVSDSHSWLNDGCTDYPLLFDRDQQPKPCVGEIMRLALEDND